MPKRPLGLRIDEELLAQIDEARGDVSRARWIERASESALGDRTGRPAGQSEGPLLPVNPDGPAPTRAPEKRLAPAANAQELMAERQRRLNAKR